MDGARSKFIVESSYCPKREELSGVRFLSLVLCLRQLRLFSAGVHSLFSLENWNLADREKAIMGGFWLFAQMGGRGGDPLRSPEVMWSTAGLAVALLAGALLVYLADRWRKGNVASATDSKGELTEFRRMYERGEITAEEYAKLRDRVAQRVKAPAPLPPSQQGVPTAGLVAPTPLPGPDQPTPPPDSGKSANPSPPA
jgi:hypothetical protein